MATIAPLAYQLPPFWHPLSVVIHLGDILVIDSNQKQLHLVSNELIEGGEISESPTPHINNGTNNNISARKRSLSITYHGEYLPERNEIDQYVNDVFQVFGKIFYSPEFSSNLKYKKQLESIGYELSNFLKTLFQIYYGNLSAMKKYHDESHVPMFVKKAITTFSHPCFTSSFTGVEVSLHFTVILGSLLRLAGWDSKFLDQSIYTSIMSTAEDFTSTWNNSTLLTPFKSNTSTDTATHESKKLLVTTPNNTSITISPGGISSTSHIHTDLATAIAMNFKSKSMDKWAQFALTLGANASTLDDLRRLLTTNSNNNGSGAVASTSASMYTSSLSLSNKTNTTILPRYSFIESIKLSGSIVAQMLWSRSQTQLFQELVGDTVAAYLTALDRERAGPAEFSTVGSSDQGQQQKASKKLLHFGGLWRGRWDTTGTNDYNTAGTSGLSTHSVGDDANAGFEGVDILSLLCQSQVPLWMHDLSPLAAVIESVALKQFSRHKSSIRVFLELVLIQKTDKLMLLAKADRNVMGVQLLTLLGYDNQSEKGRNALRKNAFALMRLQKYRYAIATFLYASPPMLKEACSVACKQLNDPFLALFIARYTEFQQGCSGCPGGLILGPCSRSVISQHILPTITDWIKERYNNKNINTSNVQLSTNNTVDSSSKWHGIRLPSFLDNISDRHIDISTLALVCTLWLQDVSLFQNTLQLCLQYQSLCIGDTADRVIYKTNLLDSNDKLEVYLNRIYNMTSLCSVIHWLRSLPIQFMSITLLEKVFFEFQSAVSSYGIMHESIEVYRVFESHKTNLTGQPRTHDINYDKQGYFFEYCKDVCNRWKEWAKTAPIVSESISDGLIVDITESGSTDTQAVQDVDEEDDDVKIARLRLSKLTATTVETIPATSSTSSTSSGIADKSNTAAESSVSIPTPPIKSGLFNLAKTNLATSPTSTAATASSPASALDMFDMPTERPVRVKIASEPTTAKSALDIFDMPIERPQRVKPVLVEPSSDPVIRADTTVKPVTVALTQTTPNAWDIFDEPIQRPPRQTK